MSKLSISSRLPKSEGQFILTPSEYVYVVYMPIKIGDLLSVPDNLKWTLPLVQAVREEDYKYHYWYLTVKYMHVSGYGNREGWHIDGYLSEDINYLWSDVFPTLFVDQDFILSPNHTDSLQEMKDQVFNSNVVKGRKNHLYRLDNTVVHAPQYCEPCFRAFVKISCSDGKYNLQGNAVNPMFNTKWDYVPRDASRNHPTKED